MIFTDFEIKKEKRGVGKKSLKTILIVSQLLHQLFFLSLTIKSLGTFKIDHILSIIDALCQQDLFRLKCNI